MKKNNMLNILFEGLQDKGKLILINYASREEGICNFFLVLRHILNFITFITNNHMNIKMVHNIISQISFYLDETTLDEIKKFIQTFIGDAWQNNPRFSIYVCAAIVCECKKVPAVQSYLQVPLGLNVEKFMKYCSDSTKQQFLNTISSIIQKWPTCPSQFIQKLQNLKLCYRIFKKYRLACKAIGQKFSIQQTINFKISNLFWLIYLVAKHLNNQSDSLEVITSVIPNFISNIYSIYLKLGHQDVLDGIISKFFTLPNLSHQSIKQTCQRYNKQFLKILSQSYSRRYLIEPSNFNFIIHKVSILQRLIDDLSNLYSKAVQSSPQFSIDQMSFLQLRKDMTPEGFHQKIDKNGIIINQKISFDNDNPPLLQFQTPQKVTSIKLFEAIEETPLTLRMQNLSWIRSCIQKIQVQKTEIIQKYYQECNITSYLNFSNKCQKILDKIINQFSPNCRDPAKRANQIYKFFIYCINIAINMYNDQIRKIFQSDIALRSIFCLCSQIFNFVYQTASGSYSKYCSIFQIDYVNAFWPINWFGYYIKLPKSVDGHLYELQRKFLLKQIWLTDLGYKIITNHEQIIRINQLRMLQRLQQHTKCRIDEICRETIGEKLVKKIYNMLIHLLQNRPNLLKKNNIDQIIICSITACLSINEDKNKFSLQKIFCFYQKASLSCLENKQKLYDFQGNELNIVDFYNNVFLLQIQEIINKDSVNSSILLTPKRLQLAEKYKEGIQMTPLRQKYKQSQSAFLKKQFDPLNPPKYSINKAINIMKQNQESMIDQSNEHSYSDDKKLL